MRETTRAQSVLDSGCAEGAGRTDTATADELLDALQKIIVAGHTLTESFNSRMGVQDASGLYPFALEAIIGSGRRGISQADLAEKLGRSAAAVTRLIDHMQKDGLVRREHHPSDRRVNMVSLSEDGLRMRNQIHASAQCARGSVPAMTPDEIGHFLRVLDVLKSCIR